uniref:MFS transporter n=1 Tax=Cyberlindnera americana TaxID=36016 RepID=A0A5P8N9E1_9ASCO|nr:MFS transporter [Cyberlindnera americana]
MSITSKNSTPQLQSPVSALEARLIPGQYPHKHQKVSILVILIVGCLNTIDSSSAALSLPHIAEALEIPKSMHWAGASYCIGLSVTTILLGRLGDAIGRNYVITTGLLLMAISHLFISIFQIPLIYFICRGVSGIASACIHSMTVLMITDLVSIANRAKTQASLGCALGIGDCIGPLLIGYYLNGPGWIWFYLTTSIILFFFSMIALYILPKADLNITLKELCKTLDYCGFVLITVFLICLVLPLMNAGISWKWGDLRTGILLCVSIISFICFFIMEMKWTQIPIIPTRLFLRSGSFNSLCQNFIIGFIFQPMQFYIPHYFTVVKGIPLDHVAMLSLTLVIPLSLSSMISGFIVNKYGYKICIILGTILWIIGIFLLAEVFGLYTNEVWESMILVIIGFGIGLELQPSIIAVQAQSLKADRSVAVTTRNVFKSIGGALGVSISSLIYLKSVHSYIQVSKELIDETKQLAVDNMLSKQLSSQLGTREGEIIGEIYTNLLQVLLFIWTNILTISLLLFVQPLEDKGIESVDENVEYLNISQEDQAIELENLGTITV